jgi:hypothetical protein
LVSISKKLQYTVNNVDFNLPSSPPTYERFTTGKSTSSKSVLFLSDMHVGSAYAVCSPHPTVGDTGGEYKPNKLQRDLYHAWLWVKDSLKQKPHILCLNGEGCDGPNKKAMGQQSWTTNVNDQLNDAERLLKVYSYDKFVVTRGSGYHVQNDATNHDEALAARLNAVPYSGYFGRSSATGKYYDDNRNARSYTDYYLYFSLHNRVFSVTHHISFTRWESYKPTALARELANVEYLRGRYWKSKDHPTFIVRSHVHYFVLIRFSTQCGFTTPAFKFPDAHLFRGGLSGTAPSIGAIEVIVEPNGEWDVHPHILSNEKYPKHQILRF